MVSDGQYPETAVLFEGVTKEYKGNDGGCVRVLHGIDLEIPRGSIYGLLGPNGAGKSTMINMMSGLVKPGGGKIEVWGMDIERESLRSRAVMGVMGQEVNFDPFFTPYEVLEMQAGLNGVSRGKRRTEEILRRVHLWDKRSAYARHLSGGMRRRLMWGKAMVSDPPIVVLDEPTAGVDVELRKEMWEYVKELQLRGVTIILTTHYLEEAEALCDRVAIINKGRKIADDEPSRLLDNFGRKEMELLIREGLEEVRKCLDGCDCEWEVLEEGEGVVRVGLRDVGGKDWGRVWSCVGDLKVEDVTTREADFEEVFLRRIREDSEAVSEKDK